MMQAKDRLKQVTDRLKSTQKPSGKAAEHIKKAIEAAKEQAQKIRGERE